MEKVSIAHHEHKGTVVDKGPFEHIMALALNPINHNEGLVRCIVKRKGDVSVKGFRDRSVLYKVKSIGGLEQFELTDPLEIANQKTVINQLIRKSQDFIGLEDPDIYFDSDKDLYHVYFTIPLIDRREKPSDIHLGHAFGKDLNSLEMTLPVLSPSAEDSGGAKELSLAPVNKQGVRLNLVESRGRVGRIRYSTIRACIASKYGPPWEFGEVVFHPAHDGYRWCAGHVSPGPFLPKSFIDIGESKLVGVINGREANKVIGKKTKYGVFSVGLFVYDFEKGKIDWVSGKPLIIDSQATTITFASQFVQTDRKTGILYAHVDDSFVRAYTLYTDGIRELVKRYS